MSTLALRIDCHGSSRIVTRHAGDLRFSRSAPGGFTTLSVTLTLPLTAFPNLGPACRVYVLDPHGKTLWEGWAENPGEQHTTAGESWRMTAVGNAVLAYDIQAPRIYVDRDLSAWSAYRSETMPQSATAAVTSSPRGDGSEGVFVGLLKGTVVGLASQSHMTYSRCEEVGQELGGIAVTVTGGRNDTDYLSQLTWKDGSDPFGSGVLQSGTGINTGTIRPVRLIGLTSPPHPPPGVDIFGLRIIRTTSGGAGSEVPDDTHWLYYTDPSVIGRRVNQYGTPLTGADLVSPEYVRADWVVADVVGRYLPLIGAELARIESPALPFEIDQLTFTDPARAADILDMLELWEPTMLWEILETVEGRGVRFAYRPWSLGGLGSGDRYELSMAAHEIELPGADVELCNRIAVAWTDSRGRERTTVVTATVPALDSVGRTHDAEPIELGPGLGSAANAARAGQLALTALNDPPLAGRAIVTGRIYDRLLKRDVEHYEIEPGYTATIREKGTSVRLTNIEVRPEDQVTEIELGTPQRSPEQVLARLGSRARLGRRVA